MALLRRVKDKFKTPLKKISLRSFERCSNGRRAEEIEKEKQFSFFEVGKVERLEKQKDFKPSPGRYSTVKVKIENVRNKSRDRE